MVAKEFLSSSWVVMNKKLLNSCNEYQVIYDDKIFKKYTYNIVIKMYVKLKVNIILIFSKYLIREYS